MPDPLARACGALRPLVGRPRVNSHQSLTPILIATPRRSQVVLAESSLPPAPSSSSSSTGATAAGAEEWHAAVRALSALLEHGLPALLAAAKAKPKAKAAAAVEAEEALRTAINSTLARLHTATNALASQGASCC
eukprot:COSAG01_NODE_16469_length_1234_cov_2.251101_2_plen_135_part_00